MELVVTSSDLFLFFMSLLPSFASNILLIPWYCHLSLVRCCFCLQAAGNLKLDSSYKILQKKSIYKREIVLAGIARTSRVQPAIGLLGHFWPCFCVLILALPLSTADLLRLITKWVASWNNRPSMTPLLPLGVKKKKSYKHGTKQDFWASCRRQSV